MKYSFLYLLVYMLFLFASCSNSGNDNATSDESSTMLPDFNNEVSLYVLQRKPFNHELVSNGKVSAKSMADLRFQSTEVISQIFVKNGERVRKGQKIAELDKYRLENKVAQTKDAIDRAALDLQDVLIGQGYNLDDLSEIPEEIMLLAKVKSNTEQNTSQYELAQFELQHATLVAPFDGIVANIVTKPHNMSSSSEPFCTIIDTRGMEVDFTVLESELPLIKIGDKVKVLPFSDTSTTYTGSITEINPLVDEKGMVSSKARLDGNHNLFAGMNVRISVYRSLENQLVIPKSAVVLRSGKQVVFTFKNGIAYWNYIYTGLENTEYYTILEGMKETLCTGDTVIVSGNINLAHETPVNVLNTP